MTASEPETGPRRHLIYIHGFDLRGPTQYHGLMAAELTRYGALRGVETSATDPAPAEHAPETSVQWRLYGGGRACDVHYFGWQDLVQKRLRLGPARRLWRGAGTMAEIAFAGPAWRMARTNWPTALFLLYPFVVLLGLALIILGPTLWLAAESWVAAPVGLALAVLIWRLCWAFEGWSYFWYLIQDHISIRDFARNRDAEISARTDAFAAEIADLIDRSPPEEEVIICGHSSGTFVALRVVDRLLALRPDIGAGEVRKPILLMLGSALGYTGYYRGATTAEEARRVIASRRILWTDVYSLKDSLCCGRFDPARRFGITAKGPGRPHLVNARLNHRLDADVYRRLRQSVFEFHFGYLYAMSDPEGFDLYDLAIGLAPWADMLRPAEAERRR